MKKALQKPKKPKFETHGLANFAKRVFRDLHFSARMCFRLWFWGFCGFFSAFFISFQIPRWFFGIFWILPGLFAFWSSGTTSGFNIAKEARELVMFGRSDARMLQIQIYKLYRYGPSPKYTNTRSDVRTSERFKYRLTSSSARAHVQIHKYTFGRSDVRTLQIQIVKLHSHGATPTKPVNL